MLCLSSIYLRLSTSTLKGINPAWIHAALKDAFIIEHVQI
jgi:hypothetical protein